MAISSNIIKKRPLFFVYSIKKNLFNILFTSFTILLVLFSNSCLLAAKNSLKLWANNVVPALFPFFIATELLSYTNLSNILSKFFSKLMRPIFNVPGCGAYSFILGSISGYPIGAKVVTDLRNSNMCSKSEGNRLLAFTNNSGPLFVLGTIGIGFFQNLQIGFLLLITHLLASVTVGFLLKFFDKSYNNSDLSNSNFSYNSIIANNSDFAYSSKGDFSIINIGNVLKLSIINAIKNILVIGGFIVLFAVIVSILDSVHVFDLCAYILSPIFKLFNINVSYIKGILVGFLELTNGLSLISSIATKNITMSIVICSFILGFGGISVLFQVLSLISNSDLSIKTYIIGKFIHGIISAIYTYIFISNFCFFNFNL